MPERRTLPKRENMAETRTLPYRKRRAGVDKTLPTRKRMAEAKKPTEGLRPTERLRPTESKFRTLEQTHRFTHPRKKKRERPREESNLLVDLLTLPILGAPRMVRWIGKKTSEAVEAQEFDEGAIQGQLLDLQMRYEMGEITAEECDEQESALLERLKEIREAKAEKEELEGRLIRKE